MSTRTRPPLPLYTEEQKRLRDQSPWTIVQGVLAPLQLLAFLVSVYLVVRFLSTGEGEQAATISIFVKTAFLYLIMYTGAIWEREVFGVWIFAKPFFWEDAVSIVVIALHTAYIAAWVFDFVSVRDQMLIALAAYAAYVVNAMQFFLKLREARRQNADFAVQEHDSRVVVAPLKATR
ncbi:MAG: 2-vinyl bacteriochlorophyllide hydratase [Steroidobacteraceae bacterium]